jgi:hypothetical protein
MGQHRSLVLGYKVVTAGRARKCYHNGKHAIRKGETAIEVRDGMRWKGYCVECGKAMVAIGRETLNDIERALIA